MSRSQKYYNLASGEILTALTALTVKIGRLSRLHLVTWLSYMALQGRLHEVLIGRVGFIGT